MSGFQQHEQPSFSPGPMRPMPGTSRQSFDKKFASPDYKSIHDEEEFSNEPPKTSISKLSRLEMHRQMNEGNFGAIVNELDDAVLDEPKSSVSGSVSSSRSVEIPPPCSMDYYAGVSTNKRSNWQGMRTR
jgi:hypothetical protein